VQKREKDDAGMKVIQVMIALLAVLGGCSESHAIPDAGLPDVGVDCSFLADGECPDGCFGFSGLRVDELPTECFEVEPDNYVWCSNSGVASFAFSCFVLPSGGFILMTEIPSDYPMDAERCDPNPWVACRR
jgi:hypothetical protein